MVIDTPSSIATHDGKPQFSHVFRCSIKSLSRLCPEHGHTTYLFSPLVLLQRHYGHSLVKWLYASPSSHIAVAHPLPVQCLVYFVYARLLTVVFVISRRTGAYAVFAGSNHLPVAR